MQYKPNENFYRFLPFWTLLTKEIRRFLSVGTQTVLTPVVTAGLYLLVFGVSLGKQISLDAINFAYIQFVVPGLILMGVITNTFQNASSSLFFSRFIGNIVELLVTPLAPLQFVLAYTLASMLRGLIVGSVVLLISMFFTSLPWVNPLSALAMVVLASFLFAQFGLIAALTTDTFDQLAIYSNFLILPLIYLGGLFYPVSMLPDFWAKVSKVNPLFYLIDGFRQSILGVGDEPLLLDFAVAIILSIVLTFVASMLVWKGKKLRV